MLKICVVEDDQRDAERLCGFIETFLKENGFEAKINVSSDERRFLADYESGCDVVFFDIELGEDNGFEVSKRIRETNEDVIIIFVTNLTQYALKGYEVSALDFLVKPINYDVFALKMKRLAERLRAKECKELLPIKTAGGLVNCQVASIRYVEVVGHTVRFHTLDGEFEAYASLKSIEKQIHSSTMVKCNNGFLVNLKFVRGIKNFELTLDNGERLLISRQRKRYLMEALNSFISGGARF